MRKKARLQEDRINFGSNLSIKLIRVNRKYLSLKVFNKIIHCILIVMCSIK